MEVPPEREIQICFTCQFRGSATLRHVPFPHKLMESEPTQVFKEIDTEQ